MYKSYKTEIKLTSEQISIIEKYFDICVMAYNDYVEYNLHFVDKRRPIVRSYKYFQLVKEGTIPNKNAEYFRKKEYANALLESLKNGEKTIFRYIRNKDSRPKLKKPGTKYVSIHFTASSVGLDRIVCERHRISIPYIGWIRLKEKGYIPCSNSESIVISGWIKKNAGRYYVVALTKEPEKRIEVNEYTDGIGIDLNINNFAVLSDGTVFENINKRESISKLEEKIVRENRKLSRMQRSYEKMDEAQKANCKRSNYYKTMHEIDTLYHRLECIRRDYICKCANEIASKNPKFIAVEDLKVNEMISDNKFAKYISKELFYEFRLQLAAKAKERGIEFRVIDKWIPTSKMCHECGYIKRNLTVDEREYICPSCGIIVDRDYNASLNIRDANKYVIW